MEIRHLYLSPGHNYVGHHGEPAGTHPTHEVEEILCLAGRGIAGDRFCDFKDNYRGQITFFAEEVYADLCARLAPEPQPSPAVFRRNVITRGIDLNALIGVEFVVQGVRFAGMVECKPCYWMNTAFAPGAEAALQGRGGLRCRILSDGILRRGNASLSHAA